MMARDARWQQGAAAKVIINDKLASRALLWVPLIIFREHGCATPTRQPFANTVSTNKTRYQENPGIYYLDWFGHAALPTS
jgi:hypothetical protein